MGAHRWRERAPSERGPTRWGHAIDYDKEIAADEKLVVQLTDPLTIFVSQELLPQAMQAYPGSIASQWSFYQLLAHPVEGRRERAARFGLSMDDLRALSVYENDDAFDEAPKPGDYARGEVLGKQWEDFPVYTEEQRTKALRGARAALARHKRNKAKYTEG
jgi:hypothetical protein